MASIFEDLLKKQLADKSGAGGRLGPGGGGLFTGSPNYNAPANPRPRPFKTPYSPLKKTLTTTAAKQARKGALKTGARFVPGLGTAWNIGSTGYDAYTAQQEGRSPLRALLKGGVEIAGGGLGAAGAGLLGVPTGPGAALTSLAGYGVGSTTAGTLFDALVPENAFGAKPYTTKGGYVDITSDGISGVKAGPRVGEGVVDTGKGAWVVNPNGKGVIWDPEANREELRKKYLTPASNTKPPVVTEKIPLVTETAPNNLPSSPEAVVANPLQQKLAEYEQGRAKATTQEEMNAVRDLGMSIHQAANPQMYEESYNPLMAATFPERYTKTPEDFIVQGGIQAPRSMIEKDAAQATAFGNKVQNIENLDVNPMYNLSKQSRLDKALAAVTASRRFKP